MKNLTYICEGCGKGIADGDGYIELCFAEVDRYRERQAAEEAEAIANDGVVQLHAELDPRPPWHQWHRHCDPDPDTEYCYWLDVKDVRTPEQLLGTTAHLMETKAFLPETGWPALIRSALRGL